jgi:hypothetical protein
MWAEVVGVLAHFIVLPVPEAMVLLATQDEDY